MSFPEEQNLETRWDRDNNVSLLEALSDWQTAQLTAISSPMGVKCLLSMWFNYTTMTTGDLHCNATWDNVYCWPPTPNGTVITRSCSVAFQETQPDHAGFLKGNAVRVCLENGSWSHGVQTDYEECANSYEEYERKIEEERQLVEVVQHILFVGSICSLLCLGFSLTVFYNFRCLWCDRVTILTNLMLALCLRFVLLLIITEPFVLGRSGNYRQVDILCKTVIVFHLYATMASVSWMFVQGLYLNRKLTTNVFSDDTSQHFVVYYLVGWAIPALLLFVYVVVMKHNQSDTGCWKGYADMPEIWIVVAPIIIALLLNALFLLNILRVILEKMRTLSLRSGDSSCKILAAAKATLILSPILGVNNLLLLYNPGGDYEKYYVVLNTIFGATQGIFVSIVYCFISQEVQETVRRWYLRRRTYTAVERRNFGRIFCCYHRSAHSVDASDGENMCMVTMLRVEMVERGRHHNRQTEPTPV